LGGWVVGWLGGWVVGWLGGWVVGWLGGWVVGWLGGWRFSDCGFGKVFLEVWDLRLMIRGWGLFGKG
jgi:hypothetical protein